MVSWCVCVCIYVCEREGGREEDRNSKSKCVLNCGGSHRVPEFVCVIVCVCLCFNHQASLLKAVA